MRDYSDYHTTYKEAIVNSGEFIFEQQLQGFEGKDVLIDGVPAEALIQYHTNPLNELKEDRKITCRSDVDIKVGSIVKILEEDENYIVITRVKQNALTKYTKILHCNNTLTYQHPITKQIHKFPCVLTDKTSVYSDGINDGKLISLADNQILIAVPNNEITRNIQEDVRFIFNHDKRAVYEASKVDTLIYNGLVYITMTRTTYDENVDNLELNIANYIESDIPAPPEQPIDPPIGDNFVIQVSGQDNINRISSGTYIATIYNNGVEVDKEVRFELSNSLASIRSQDGNSCIVDANVNWKYGQVILKVVLVEDETVFIEKTINVTGL